MTFREAQSFRMPFGKHKGRTLDEIARSDEGLRYLDFMYGDMEKPSPTMTALAAYLGDAAIQRELAGLEDDHA